MNASAALASLISNTVLAEPFMSVCVRLLVSHLDSELSRGRIITIYCCWINFLTSIVSTSVFIRLPGPFIAPVAPAFTTQTSNGNRKAPAISPRLRNSGPCSLSLQLYCWGYKRTTSPVPTFFFPHTRILHTTSHCHTRNSHNGQQEQRQRKCSCI